MMGAQARSPGGMTMWEKRVQYKRGKTIWEIGRELKLGKKGWTCPGPTGKENVTQRV